jgi:outer membrane autotransporter protein
MTLGRIEIGGRYDLTERLSGYGRAHYTAGSDYDATAAGLGLSYHW